MPYEKIKHQFVERAPFFGTVGVVLQSVGKGTARAGLDTRKDISNHLGTIHAGALFTLAEGTSGAAVIGAFADIADSIRAVSTQCTISYLNIARGHVVCDAHVREPVESLTTQLEKSGQVECSVDVRVATTTDKDIAKMTATWIILKRRTPSL